MKKYISFLVCAIMMMTLITGCSGKPETTAAAPGTEATEPSVTETDPITEETTEPVTTEPQETLPVVTEDEEAMKAEPASSFTVSRAFGDGMILQRNEYIRIWGWADDSQNGKRVEAEFSGLHGAAVIENGEWMLTLGGTLPECTEGKQLRVFGADGTEYKYEDVLVGDVYWVIGQSNVWYPVSYIKNEPLANEKGRNAEISNELQIRLNRTFAGDFAGIDIGTDAVSRDVVNKRGWQKPEQGAMDFSALGYFNALMIYEQLERKVPVGMIEFDGNGCALHAFLPNKVRDDLKISTLSGGHYTAAGANAHVSSFMYNHGMYSFRKMPIRGILWYQGESDLQTANDNCTKYAERFTALIKYLRDDHDQLNHDYPVYIVELPPIFIAFDFAAVRDNMGLIPTMLDEAYICTTSDLWSDRTYNKDAVRNSLHPYNKWEISERMSAMILAHDDGIGELDQLCGPQIDKIELSEDRQTVTLTYKYTGGGLKSDSALKGFKVKTEKKTSWAKPASMEITGENTVVIKANAPITQVAYETQRDDTFPKNLTLSSGTGIPAGAFSFPFPAE